MHISAKVDYAVRALIALTVRDPECVTGAELAKEQNLPGKFLEGILSELRRSGIVTSSRGAVGGYSLAKSASAISLADVIRAIDGPLAEVRGQRPETATYEGSAAHLQEVWIAVRAALRGVLERTTLAQVASGKLPASVKRLSDNPDAWLSH